MTPRAATVSITVTPVNDASVADAQAATTAEDTAKDITLTGSDLDGDALVFSIGTQPAHGTVVLNGAIATYTPAGNYHGPDSFTFVVNDTGRATCTVRVTPVNDASGGDGVDHGDAGE